MLLHRRSQRSPHAGSPKRQLTGINGATAINFFSRQDTNVLEEIQQESPRGGALDNLHLGPDSADYLKMVLSDRLIEPIIHTHQFKGKSNFFAGQLKGRKLIVADVVMC